MAKGKERQSRRDLIEQMQRDQARSDRHRTMIIVAVSVLVGLGIIAYPAIKLVQDSRARNTPVAGLGVPVAQASRTTSSRRSSPSPPALSPGQ